MSRNLPAVVDQRPPTVRLLNAFPDAVYGSPVLAGVAAAVILLGLPWAAGPAISFAAAVGIPLLLIAPLIPDLLGSAWVQLGRPDRAARTFRWIARSAGPGSQRQLVARVNEGACWLSAGRVAEGKSVLSGVDLEALNGFQRTVQVVNLSHLYWQLGDGEEALAMADAAAGMDGGDSALARPYVVINAAQALVQLGRFEEALDRFEDFDLDALPGRMRPHARSLRALALALGPGEAEEAAAEANRALKEAARLHRHRPTADVAFALSMWMLNGSHNAAFGLSAALPEHHETIDPVLRVLALMLDAAAHRAEEEEAAAALIEEELPPGEITLRVGRWLERLLPQAAPA